MGLSNNSCGENLRDNTMWENPYKLETLNFVFCNRFNLFVRYLLLFTFVPYCDCVMTIDP